MSEAIAHEAWVLVGASGWGRVARDMDPTVAAHFVALNLRGGFPAELVLPDEPRPPHTTAEATELARAALGEEIAPPPCGKCGVRAPRIDPGDWACVFCVWLWDAEQSKGAT